MIFIRSKFQRIDHYENMTKQVITLFKAEDELLKQMGRHVTKRLIKTTFIALYKGHHPTGVLLLHKGEVFIERSKGRIGKINSPCIIGLSEFLLRKTIKNNVYVKASSIISFIDRTTLEGTIKANILSPTSLKEYILKEGSLKDLQKRNLESDQDTSKVAQAASF